MILYEGLNNLTWFMGIVQRINDPKHEGRVKVRAFGFHPTIAEGTVSADDLPWATVLVNNVSVSAKLAIGELVFGAFLDGRDAQQPLIFGVIPTPKFGIPTLEPTGSVGDMSANDQSQNNATPAYVSGTAEGVLRTIKARESGGDYTAENGGTRYVERDANGNAIGSTASGAYQFIDSTWQERATAAGIGTEYSHAADAPPAIQDAVAGHYVNDILAKNNNNVAAIPNVWFTGNAQGNMSAEQLSVNRGQTSATYQKNWLEDYFRITGTDPGIVTSTLPSTAPYTPLVSSTIESYGQGALPPQRTGEGIHHTPLAPALANFQKSTGDLYHPGLAVGGSHNTTVINASYNGSYIEMHGGDGENNEHINIIHKSGAHIALDQNGNVTIGAIGRLHVVSINDFEQQVGGHTTNISDGGYSIRVENGGIQLHSVGDLSISSNSNINIAAAGDIVLNSGTSLDIKSARVGLSATAGGVGVLSSEGIQLQSVGDTTVKGANFNVNAATVGIEATGGNATIKGTEVHLNDGSVATVADTQGAANIEKPPTAGIATKKQSSPTTGGISINQIDDTV
jgi:hypothetical protein